MSQKPLPAAADLFGDLLDNAPQEARGIRTLIPGLTVTIVASLAAAWLSEHYGAPLMLMGLLIGLAFNFANADPKLHAGLGLASKSFLRWGIVLAGLQVTLWQIADLGWASFVWIAAMIAIVTSIGALTARAMGLSMAFGTLAGGSVAICGASAALALSSVLGEKRTSQMQLTLVLVTISAASALAMSFYPALASLFGFTDRQAGWLVGGSIHDVAQAMGAGYSFSEEAGQTATIVKLTRVALLAPALAAVALLFPAETGEKRARIGLPWFVVGFLLLGAIRSFLPVPAAVTDAARHATQAFLLMAVTAAGIRSPMHLLFGQGWRSMAPIIAATIAAFLLSLLAALLIA